MNRFVSWWKSAEGSAARAGLLTALPMVAGLVLVAQMASEAGAYFPAVYVLAAALAAVGTLAFSRLRLALALGPDLVLDLIQAHFEFSALDVQGFQLCQLVLQCVPLGFRLGQQAAFVIPTAVLQVLQLLCQPVRRAALVSGGNQSIQAAPQGFVLGHRQIGKADEACPAEHRLLHPQQQLAAVRRRQLLHRQAGSRIIGREVSNERTGLIAGSGGASCKNTVEAADILRSKGVRRVGPYMVPPVWAVPVPMLLAR